MNKRKWVDRIEEDQLMWTKNRRVSWYWFQNGLMVVSVVWLALAAVVPAARAQTQTWEGGTTGFTDDFDNGNNWNPLGTPVASTSAVFGSSGFTSIGFSQTTSSVGSLTFNAGAPAYTFNLDAGQGLTAYGSNGNVIVSNSSNAVTFNMNQGNLSFSGGAVVQNGTGTITFNLSGSLASPGQLAFLTSSSDVSSSAGTSIINVGYAGILYVYGASTAGSADITLNSGGGALFENSGSAGNATITVNNGGGILFAETSTGGNAQIINNSGGLIDISDVTTPGFTFGSIAGGGTFNLGSEAVTVGGNNLSTTVGGTINDGGLNGGTGASLIKAGTGVLTLSGANTYSGGTTIQGGTLQIYADNNLGATTGGLTFNGGTLETSAKFSTARTVTIGAGGGTFNTDSGTTLTLSAGGILTGTGDLTKSGAGTLVLAGNDSGYTGSITISSGTLAAGSTGAFVSVNNLTVNGTLDLNGFSNSPGTVSGSGNITNNGSTTAFLAPLGAVVFSGNMTDGNSSLGLTLLSGTSQLSGNNTYSGETSLQGGVTLQALSMTALSPNSPFELNTGSTVDLGGYNNSIASLSGGGRVTTTGGNAVLTVLNPTVHSATTFSGNLVDGSSSSTLGLTVDGTGNLTLSGNNSYSGPTTLNGTLLAFSTTALSPNSAFTINQNGVIFLNGFSNTIGSLSGSGVITNSASPLTLTIDETSSTTFSGTIEDIGGVSAVSLVKEGTGTLTLSGNNINSGSTTVEAGVLNVTGSMLNLSTNTPSVIVDATGTLAGTGTISEPVVINNGGTLAPGIPSPTAVGTLTVSSLTLNSGSILNYELGVPNEPGSTFNDLVAVKGSLTLAGTLNITNIGGFGEGVYELFTYGGTLTNNGLNFGTLPTNFTSSDLLLYTGQIGQVDLLVSASGFIDQFWDGSTTSGPGAITGGSGTWNNTTTNWTNMTGAVNAPWQSGFAIFEGTAGTVTLGDNINFIGAQFVTTGYVITAGGTAYTLTATQTAADGGTIINVDPNVTATIEAPIVGAGEIVKTDRGTLILAGTNTYSGGTTISGGVLQIGNGGTTGSIVGNVIDNAGFVIDLAAPLNLTGNISGTGTLQQNGIGQTILSGVNTYSGVTTVGAGTLSAGSVNGFSPNSQFDVNTGAILNLKGFSNTIGSLTGNGLVVNLGTATPATLSVGNDNTSTTFAGAIGEVGFGTLALNKIGTGTLTLTGTNVYNSGTTISGGTLQLGDDGLTGSIPGNVTDNAIFAIDRSNTYIFAGTISGTGSLEQEGKGTTILTGNDTYKAGTTIQHGVLQVGNGGTTGSITGKVIDRSLLAFDRSNAYSFGGAISGDGSVVQLGNGALTLSGTNSYSGGTKIATGTLVVDSAAALGTGNVTVNGGVLTADPQAINVVGNYFQGPNGTLQLQIAGASPGQYDYLNVAGNASLGGTLQLVNQGFTPQAGETLTLVKTGGVITNIFAKFIDPFNTRAGLNTIDLVYSANSVDLEFLNIVTTPPPVPPQPPQPPSPPAKITTINFASFAQTPNELAAAELLDTIELNPRASGLVNFFLSQSFTNIPNDLAIISPESLTAFDEISFSGANLQRLTLENRLDEIRLSGGTFNTEPSGGTVGLQKGSSDGKTDKNPVEPVLQPVVKPLFDLWASGFGDFVNVDSDFNARGYRFTTSGFDLGFDYRFLDHFAVGVMGNYAYTWTDLRPGTITVNSGRGGVYASYFTGGYYLNGGVYGGYNTYDTNRSALFGNAIGNTNGQEWSGFISTGYDFHHGNLTIGPTASLQYTNVNVSGFTETGSLVPMSIHSDSEESLRSDVGFKAFYQWHAGNKLIEPYVKTTWEHEYKYSALPVTASLAGFPGPDETFDGPVEGQDSAVLSAGISVQWTPLVSTYAGYDGQLGRGHYNSNAVEGGVRLSW